MAHTIEEIVEAVQSLSPERVQHHLRAAERSWNERVARGMDSGIVPREYVEAYFVYAASLERDAEEAIRNG